MSDPVRGLLALLAEEREAIRKLDGQAVEAFAVQKAAFADALAALDLSGRRDEVVVLRAELRRNGILLAHARACLREAATFGQSRLQATV